MRGIGSSVGNHWVLMGVVRVGQGWCMVGTSKWPCNGEKGKVFILGRKGSVRGDI